jgi:sulfur carrier protein
MQPTARAVGNESNMHQPRRGERNLGRSSMKLHINGEEREFSGSATPFTLAALVESLGMKSDRVAVELNRDIVSRDRWSETTLNDGDRLEVVHFVGGGSSSHSREELS